MTSNQKKYANTLKRIIKTGMNVLGMDDGTYRMMLKRVSKSVSGKEKNSITQMSIDELNAVIDDMREHGFEPKRGKRPSTQSSNRKTNSPRTKEFKNKRPILGKILATWIAMYQQGIIRDGSDEALNNFARKNANKQRNQQGLPLVLNMNAMTDYELYVVLETLKSWQQRELTKRGGKK